MAELTTRRATISRNSYNAETRTFTAVIATATPVKRVDYFENKPFQEVLLISPKAMRLERLSSTRAPLLNSHRHGTMTDQIGVITAVRIEGGNLVADIQLSNRPDVQLIATDIAAGIIGSVSIGYRVHASEERTSVDGTRTITHVDWEPYEVSLVAVPADQNAHIRSHPGDLSMEPAPENIVLQPTPTNSRDADLIARAERTRITEIRSLGAKAGVEAAQIEEAVDDGTPLEAFRVRCFEEMASRAERFRSSPITVGQDETETRVVAASSYLGSRMLSARGAPIALTGAARGYDGLTIADIAAQSLGHRGRITSDAHREELIRRAFHTTSDFPAIFENAMNGTLARRYQASPPTYRKIAAQRHFKDFRPHRTVRVGDFPTLQPINEAGEIKFGTFSESKEVVSVFPYAVQFALSRTMLVNDDMGALDDLLGSAGQTVANFEEASFYAMMLSNAGAGPTLVSDGLAVFHATHGNLAGSGTAITVAAVGSAREAMRNQRTLDGQLPNIAPAIILVGPKKETEADALVASITPRAQVDVNPFSGKLEPVVAAHIPGNAWFIFANPQSAPVFQWGLLDGYEAPRVRLDQPFGRQGLGVSLEHDFGCGAIDFRGAYRNAGA
ncbi:prohead protease/major capsid protein fusion protein [Microvirga antarctica]|uniref:prohead protease/major capsid protein fusion protein n=1 Tax=Microvirga antarctica TaxID=2819233 RepID=UPI001B302564|nr:prohead protease/major capsid protein fusion protein [Microvirga antarctica]